METKDLSLRASYLENKRAKLLPGPGQGPGPDKDTCIKTCWSHVEDQGNKTAAGCTLKSSAAVVHRR
ncbi:unnamed protein product [Fusarium graminearum]|uniref:Chromosome 3, complete genome n=2 Tax=Gibberella zeae TaxID=5518 RepID=A0A098E1E1_GIBZE|nr:unnamed protein product [Fusarium graminearum]CAF3568360.1 unnamed protein product [Fusarium graminearum]CAG2000848.1 unnamed protein product [Fusarium graminearum]CAG2007948.1 unnamed protein product [Fusarium graminearum]CEF87417.1 unnamed protein product [Fusarium graminearum]